MKIMVLVADYPDLNGNIALMYTHTRNINYTSRGIEVTVLNFKTKNSYTIDGINVISLKDYKENHRDINYDILICHAPNIRNHYRFLKKYEKEFPKMLFFFHGHEILRINEVYPEPYFYMKKSSIVMRVVQDVYDSFKLKLWRKYIPNLISKSHLVFVSRWMYSEFLKWSEINLKVIDNKVSIIHNSVGETFEKESYRYSDIKKYDFITIRSYLDGSKYCIDLVNELAKSNPQHKFLVIGTGSFFEHYEIAENIEWINKQLTHEEIKSYLNQAKCALMPTRTDAQGLMMCEMATFGIPVVTSDIDVCRDICDEFENVVLINNNNTRINLTPILNDVTSKLPYTKVEKYFAKQTSDAEVKLIKELYGK